MFYQQAGIRDEQAVLNARMVAKTVFGDTERARGGALDE